MKQSKGHFYYHIYNMVTEVMISSGCLNKKSSEKALKCLINKTIQLIRAQPSGQPNNI